MLPVPENDPLVTPAQIAILRQRFPSIGEPALRRNAATLLANADRGGKPPVFGIAPADGPTKLVAGIVMPDAAKKRIRQHQGDGMNKWEREYLAVLDIQWSHIYREVSLPLANGVRYKLDFLCVSTAHGRLIVEGHEVKGRNRAAGTIKIKVAAAVYPWIKFILATKRRKKDGGGWATEPVLP